MHKKVSLIISIFRIYQEKMTRRMELKQQFDRINYQLHFEEHESKEHKNIESKFPNDIFVNVLSLTNVFIYV